MTADSTPRSWWRTNRWWLPLVPVGLVLMLLGSGYRVQTFWWESGLHREAATAGPGRWARVSEKFEDQLGPTRRTFQVRVDGLDEVDQVPVKDASTLGSPPKGVKAYRLSLAFRAAPDQDLNGCTVLLLDRHGDRYGGDATDPLGQDPPCVPAATPGPRSPLLEGDRRGVVDPASERPGEWTTRTIVLVPRGTTPRRVWVSFGAPDYVSLEPPR